jgi:hypothetical protein
VGTAFTLFVLPSIYFLLAAVHHPKQGNESKDSTPGAEIIGTVS